MVRTRPGPIILIVALLIATRVLGISALMPVFSPFGLTLTDRPLLVGIAFGAYGLTMALMQVPMGTLSDRFGRRPLILIGLGLYILGNLLAWQATTIGFLIVARLIEGLGAVSSVALALVADVVPEERRTFSIAMAGIGAGVAFLLGVSLGPFVALAIGVPGIFLASAILGTLMFGAVVFFVPEPERQVAAAKPAGFWATLRDRRALAVDAAGFVMNLTLTATMFALPLLLVGDELTAAGYRRLLLGTVLVGGILAVGAARAADRRGKVRAMAAASALLIGAGAVGLLWQPGLILLVVFGLLYFGGHGAQSAALPSLVGRLFPGARRGTAMGGLNTFTYLGSFAGGALGGLLIGRGPALLVLVAALGLGAALALIALPRDEPRTKAPKRI